MTIIEVDGLVKRCGDHTPRPGPTGERGQVSGCGVEAPPTTPRLLPAHAEPTGRAAL
ncbi:hypothetical protein [Umezawaea sp.]|uniref:hypothetical protein n=1 Tax=Umezawaea sp. TaxID=1955258 RepID=UPI002ECFF679